MKTVAQKACARLAEIYRKLLKLGKEWENQELASDKIRFVAWNKKNYLIYNSDGLDIFMFSYSKSYDLHYRNPGDKEWHSQTLEPIKNQQVMASLYSFVHELEMTMDRTSVRDEMRQEAAPSCGHDKLQFKCGNRSNYRV